MNTELVGSIVTFNPRWNLLVDSINTFLASSPESSVMVWDNSIEDKISEPLKKTFGEKVTYRKSPANLGYGSGHNRNFQALSAGTKYFAVLNPDIKVPNASIPLLTSYLKSHPQYGLASTSISGFDGAAHAVHKPLPSFLGYVRTLLARKFKVLAKPAGQENPFFPLPSNPVSIPVVSGCFMFFTVEHYNELHGFDERFFLYFEDYDISLRSFMTGKSIVIPSIKIEHNWERSSHKRLRVLFIHLKSAFQFYRKWGFGISLAKRINRQAISTMNAAT